MRYETLSTHPFIVPGKILTGVSHYSFFRIEGHEPAFPHCLIDAWADKGWIEEIQEPIWTNSDMIKFAQYCNTDNYEIYTKPNKETLEAFKANRQGN